MLRSCLFHQTLCSFYVWHNNEVPITLLPEIKIIVCPQETEGQIYATGMLQVFPKSLRMHWSQLSVDINHWPWLTRRFPGGICYYEVE